MRIISGKFRHRIIMMTNLDTTRETQDNVREAIFNTIGQFFSGGVVLDLFAGSGAMGLEAISRGMDKAYFNDINNKALGIVKKNIASLKLEDACVLTNMDYKKAIQNYDIAFDLIILDPPYALTEVDELMELIDKCHILKSTGKIVFEMGRETKYSSLIGSFKATKEKFYGIKKVVVYEVNTNEANG